jgi:putative glutamine amidotransferase
MTRIWPVPNAHGGDAPLIGISTYRELAQWRTRERDAAVLPFGYPDQVAQAGGVPVLLPPLPGAAAAAVARLDGLLLSGGADIDPARYGAELDPATGPACPDRDAAEAEMLAAALEAGLPVLAICRGMHMLNVALGGTLHQHLPDVVGHDGHSPVPGGYGTHEVRVAPGSRIAAAVGRTDLVGHLAIQVPTHHHQAVDRLGEALAATAWAADGVIEAVELDGARRFAVGVQWHPEVGDDPSLFRSLVAAARET